jgi:hypothetical protein
LFGKVIAQALQSGEGESYAIKAMIRKMWVIFIIKKFIITYGKDPD